MAFRIQVQDIQSEWHCHQCQSLHSRKMSHLPSKMFCVETSFEYSENYVISFLDTETFYP